MNEPAWMSQPFPAEGASAAEGIRNQLGKPQLDNLTVLVRESAQNSWDARCDDETSVDFRIDLLTVSAAHSSAWREHFQRRAPRKDYLPLRDSLQRSTIRLLSISDRGTRGLGGPTRADEVSDETRDFVAFLRNIGEPRDQKLGGGTYGFGKGILYLLSRCGTILVYTRCRYQGRIESRLMGASLWQSYQAEESSGPRRYTGRHWWGAISDNVVEPLIGVDADVMANRLGLRGFGDAETGTTIAIVDPILDEREPVDTAQYLAETVAWHLWPKMLPTYSGRRPMRFSVTCDGIEHPVPDPESLKPLRPFVAAYRRMNDPESREELRWYKKRLLGYLGLHRFMFQKFEPSDAAHVAGFDDGLLHHICLVRPAELVVTYWPGPKPTTEFTAYAGVFRADVELDSAYAAAEPPTHDSWNYHSLEHPESSYVKTTFTRLKESVEKILGTRNSGQFEVAQVSLGAAAERLSPLIGGTWGVGSATDYGKPGDTRSRTPRRVVKRPKKGRQPVVDAADRGHDVDFGDSARPDGGNGYSADVGAGAPKQKPARRRPRIEYVGDPFLEEFQGAAVLVQQFRLPVTGPQRITADLAVALSNDTGLELDPPAGADMPLLIGWRDSTGELHSGDTRVVHGGANTWQAVVKPAADTMTNIRLQVEAVEI
ncbi:hypothetical protein [Nocardia vermiculata]|uniref:Uncharacterized protein n=1 Tax=Nocardia vermiculata TaxID=257274 RepID=A0A846Y5S4_9NOCA|nr:hypothetical protein [Nocardia vermiculata]NKY52039.1 hypothetical protein [Nocardia vermiculata]